METGYISHDGGFVHMLDDNCMRAAAALTMLSVAVFFILPFVVVPTRAVQHTVYGGYAWVRDSSSWSPNLVTEAPADDTVLSDQNQSRAADDNLSAMLIKLGTSRNPEAKLETPRAPEDKHDLSADARGVWTEEDAATLKVTREAVVDLEKRYASTGGTMIQDKPSSSTTDQPDSRRLDQKRRVPLVHPRRFGFPLFLAQRTARKGQHDRLLKEVGDLRETLKRVKDNMDDQARRDEAFNRMYRRDQDLTILNGFLIALTASALTGTVMVAVAGPTAFIGVGHAITPMLGLSAVYSMGSAAWNAVNPMWIVGWVAEFSVIGYFATGPLVADVGGVTATLTAPIEA
jgi:hypothetical protein